MAKPVHVLGLSGSLRKGSFNTAALHAAIELVPDGMTIEPFDITTIPFFNADLELTPPEPVQHFAQRIAAADAMLIVSPEYNYSVPGVLKNAIDWASRLQSRPLNEKPVAVMGASTGPWGTVRVQLHLRQIFVFVNMLPMQQPQVFINKAEEKFDAQGHLTDEATRKAIRALLESLQRWTIRLRGGE